MHAQDNLGACYVNGTGVPKDLKEAVRYFRLAADQGDAQAQLYLGGCYLNGSGVLKEAVRYYRLAADQGNAHAQRYLGACYANGVGVPKDIKEAVRYYQLAADQNIPQANEALKNPIFASFVKFSTSKPLDDKTGALAIIPCLLECDVCKKLCVPNYCASWKDVLLSKQSFGTPLNSSKECQKIAWKAGHKITCNKI